MKLRFVVCAMIFAAGVLVGRLSWGTRSEPGVTAVEAVSSADYAIAVPLIEAPPDGPMDRAMDGKEKLPGDLPDPEADPEAKGSGENLELVRRMSELQKSGLLNFSVQVYDQDRHITKAIKHMLEMTDVEEAALNKLLDDTKAKIQEVEWSGATTRTDGDKVIVTVPPFPEAGGKIYDQALERLTGILGEERGQMFDQIGQIADLYNDFGAADRTITVTPMDGVNKGKYQVVDELKMQVIGSSKDLQYGGGRSSTSVGDNRESLTKKYGAQMVDRLLDSFGK